MVKLTKKLVTLVFAFLVTINITACDTFAPEPFLMEINTPEMQQHTPDSRQGWQDGCKTGLAVYGNKVYKAFYQYTRDATKVGNRLYELAWFDAYQYCRHYANAWHNDPW